MTNATLAPEHAAAWQFGLADAMPDLIETGTGTFAVHGLKVFKAATFKDSRGRKKTWTVDELDQIVTNFNGLRASGNLVDVPVRADHSGSVNSVLGYYTALRREADFLVADIEFTEPDGADKYRRKTFRSRSIEIGAYETNGQEPKTYYPVALGLAFVDLGAVEGLFRSSNLLEENTVDPTTFRVNGVPTTDTATVQGHIDELEKAPAPKEHTFRIAGADESDFAKVQAHVESLETFKAETLDAARTGFVDQLVTDKKITAPTAEGLKAFAKSLTAEQYESWKATYAAAPALFGKVGDGNGSVNNAGEKTQEEQDAINALDIVRNHRRAEMPEAQLRETASFKRYVALTGKDPA